MKGFGWFWTSSPSHISGLSPIRLMELSITTDYARDVGDPSPYLRRIAEAGFSHVHWCHQWNTAFVYSTGEIGQILRWLTDNGLRVLDLHGSIGPGMNWASSREDERLAGVELARNRIEMTARLGGDVTILHIPEKQLHDPLRKSLDVLEPFCRERGIRIAVENGSFEAIEQVLLEYGADYVGLCYDSGHGNIDGPGLNGLEALKNRLISVHLHDNDGTSDQHNPLFSGTVDWPRLARVIADSAYTKCVSMEVTMHNSGIEDEMVFLKHAFETGTQFSGMIDEPLILAQQVRDYSV